VLQYIVDNSFEAAQGGYITLERGIATITLLGIDVPFHSRYLWAGVLPFHACISFVERARLTGPCSGRPVEEDQFHAPKP